MVKIRVEGLPAEVEAATEKLKKIYHILSESKQYKNRRRNQKNYRPAV